MEQIGCSPLKFIPFSSRFSAVCAACVQSACFHPTKLGTLLVSNKGFHLEKVELDANTDMPMTVRTPQCPANYTVQAFLFIPYTIAFLVNIIGV